MPLAATPTVFAIWPKQIANATCLLLSVSVHRRGLLPDAAACRVFDLRRRARLALVVLLFRVYLLTRRLASAMHAASSLKRKVSGALCAPQTFYFSGVPQGPASTGRGFTYFAARFSNRRSRHGELVLARIAGVNIPTNKRVVIALQYIHGVGPKKAEEICAKVNIPAERRVSELTDAEVLQIRETIDRDYLVEGDLRREVAINIKRLMDLGCYRGLRHRRQLPVRGQRTHTNARTRKGKAKPIAGKKK